MPLEPQSPPPTSCRSDWSLLAIAVIPDRSGHRDLGLPSAEVAFHGMVATRRETEIMVDRIRSTTPFTRRRTRQPVHDRYSTTILALAKAANCAVALSPT